MKIIKRDISPNNWKFSLFFNVDKGLNNCTPSQTIGLKRLFEIYRSSYLVKQSLLLSQASEEDKVKLKNSLPYFTYSGTYSYRNTQSILTYNSSLLPLDIDGISTQEAIAIQNTLSKQKGCVMSIISPRGKGVKALFCLGCEIDIRNHYNTLRDNITKIAKNLCINEYQDKIDIGQFKLPQAFFIAYSPYNYFNEEAIPTDWVIANIPKKVIEYKAPTLTNRTPSNSEEEKRLYHYFLSLCKSYQGSFASLSKGERHNNIWRVGGLSKYIHYIPSFENEFKDIMLGTVKSMYDSEEEFIQSRAKKTFEICWEYGIREKANNTIIEQIISEY